MGLPLWFLVLVRVWFVCCVLCAFHRGVRQLVLVVLVVFRGVHGVYGSDGVYGADGLPRGLTPFGEKCSRLGASAPPRSKVEDPVAVSLQVFTRSKRKICVSVLDRNVISKFFKLPGRQAGR